LTDNLTPHFDYTKLTEANKTQKEFYIHALILCTKTPQTST